MDQTLRQEFRSDFLKVQTLMNEYDPCSLIQAGAPDDEYDDLTYKVISLSYAGKTRQEIKNKILFELEHKYGCINLGATEDNHQLALRLSEDLDEFLEKVHTAIR